MPKILLVEDNEMNRDMLSRRLARRGFDVVIAADGEEGVRMARAELPDLILMDMSLPVLDGWGAARQLKARSKHPIHPFNRAHCACDGRRSRQSSGGRLR